MGITDTNGRFNTKVARKMLDEYDNDYLQHDRQLAAIATQTCAIIKDAARLYEENDMLRDMVGKLSSTMSEKIMELETENARMRELLEVMPRCWNGSCDGCKMAINPTVHGADTCMAESKLRKLGVEVG